MKKETFKNIFSSRRLLQVLFFVAAVAILAYFFPREGKFRYNFQEGKPWKYGLLTAPFDFPIYKDDAQVKQETDSIMQNFQPIFKQDKETTRNAIRSFGKQLKAYKEMEIPTYLYDQIMQSVRETYNDGIVEPAILEQLNANQRAEIRLIDGQVTKEYPTARLRTPKSAYEHLLQQFPDAYTHHILQSNVLNEYLLVNLQYDEETSEKVKEGLLQRISLSDGVVQVGERIIDRGEIVTHDTYRILKSLETVSLKKISTDKQQKGYSIIGAVIVFTCLMAFFYVYLRLFRPRYFNDLRTLLFLMLSITAMACAAFGISQVRLLGIYLVPFALIPIVVITFLDSRTALYTHLITILICSFVAPFPLEFLFLQTVIGMAAIDNLRDLVKRSQLMQCALLVFFVYCVSYLGYTLLIEGDLSKINWNMFLYLGINCISLLFAYLLIYILEKLFGFISTVTLVELSDVNTPVLRDLSEACPGTFQHSLQVSNLAAAAANKIGAQAQLVRTGALYHDIGKLKNPAFFTENQSGVNPHSALRFDQSAQIIISHVNDGLKLAEKLHLPQSIRNFIAMHHGQGKAKYFYNSFVNKYPDLPVDEALFSYPGPNPDSKETGILMMADAVEAASRSLSEYNEESISKLVNNIINGQIADGLLKDTPLSFKDVEDIKQTFIEKLKTIYHTRVSYPELNKKEAPAQRIQKIFLK